MISNKYLNNLQIITNCVCQGIGHADKTERLYKIFFSLFAWLICTLIFNYTLDLSLKFSIITGIIVGHSLNWLINCNLSVLFIHRLKWWKTNEHKLIDHLESIQKRLQGENWLLYSISHGGICRGSLDKYSDIDVSLIRKPGIKNAILAILFYIKEKKIADIKGIPMDIMIVDNPEDCIVKSNYQKNPVVLYDPNDMIDVYYPSNEKITIDEARKLNNIT